MTTETERSDAGECEKSVYAGHPEQDKAIDAALATSGNEYGEAVAWLYDQLMHDSMGGWAEKIERSDPRLNQWVKAEDLQNVRPLYSAQTVERLTRERITAERDAMEMAGKLNRAEAALAEAEKALKPMADNAKARCADAPEWSETDVLSILVSIGELRAGSEALATIRANIRDGSDG